MFVTAVQFKKSVKPSVHPLNDNDIYLLIFFFNIIKLDCVILYWLLFLLERSEAGMSQRESSSSLLLSGLLLGSSLLDITGT